MDFNTIWDKYKSHLFNVIKGKVSSHEIAEDILQEVAVKFYDALKNGKIENHKPWLFQVTRNTIADYYRSKSKNELPTPSVIPDLIDRNNYNACVCDLTVSVIKNYLPEKYGKALHMADIENIPHKKIAETLNISLTATKSRVQRARKIIKERVENCLEITYNQDGSISSYNLKPGCTLPPELLQEMERLNLSV